MFATTVGKKQPLPRPTCLPPQGLTQSQTSMRATVGTSPRGCVYRLVVPRTYYVAGRCGGFLTAPDGWPLSSENYASSLGTSRQPTSFLPARISQTPNPSSRSEIRADPLKSSQETDDSGSLRSSLLLS